MSSPKDLRLGLPTAFRGYDRAATDATLHRFVHEVDELVAERNRLQKQLEEATAELEQHRERARAVGDALVSAQQLAADLRAQTEAERAEQQREVVGVKEAAVVEASEIREQARHEATEIVRESRIRADRVIDEVAVVLSGYREDTDHYLDEARTKLDTLVQSVLERIPASAAPVPVEAEVEAAVEETVANADEPPADAVVAA